MIPGLQFIDSGKPGPCLGITACTHGDEPAGLAALDYVRGLEIKRGSIYLIVVNLKGSEAYKKARNDDERRAARFIDINFNRLPDDALTRDDDRYEIQRLKKLMPAFERFDCAMDIHSTTQEAPPMIVRGSSLPSDLIRGFPIDIMISRIDEFQIGLPGFAFHGGEKMIPSFEIESGSHENPESEKLAIECTKQLLINLDMIEGEPGPAPKLLDYEICDTLLFPNKSYKLVKVLKNFEAIVKGQILANGDQGPLLAKEDGHAFFGPKSLTPAKWDEEVLFISKPKAPYDG